LVGKLVFLLRKPVFLVVANTTGVIHIKIMNEVVYDKELTLSSHMVPVSNVQCDAQNTKPYKLVMASYGVSHVTVV
jgi:hypothetical protein